MATTAKEYQAKAADVLKQLKAATNESERVRLRRAHGVYLKLSTHGAEAAARAALKPEGRIRPEKQPLAPPPPKSYFK